MDWTAGVPPSTAPRWASTGKPCSVLASNTNGVAITDQCPPRVPLSVLIPWRPGYPSWCARAPQPLGPVQVPPDLTPAQWNARAAFDLDAWMCAARPGLNVQNLTAAKSAALEAFAKDTLGARRTSDDYLRTLGRVLERARIADGTSAEFILSSRDEALGSRQTLRTLQGQLEAAGFLVREERPQGGGFVGVVFVWQRPQALHEGDREHVGRRTAMPEAIQPADVPF